MTNRAPINIDADLHKHIKITAATEGVSMKTLAERLLRLGMAAQEMSNVLVELRQRTPQDPIGFANYEAIHAALVSYDAAMEELAP